MKKIGKAYTILKFIVKRKYLVFKFGSFGFG